VRARRSRYPTPAAAKVGPGHGRSRIHARFPPELRVTPRRGDRGARARPRPASASGAIPARFPSWYGMRVRVGCGGPTCKAHMPKPIKELEGDQ